MKKDCSCSKMFKFGIFIFTFMMCIIFAICESNPVKGVNKYLTSRNIERDGYSVVKTGEEWYSSISYSKYKGKYDEYHKSGSINIIEVGIKTHQYDGNAKFGTNDNYITISLEVVLPASKIYRTSTQRGVPHLETLQVKDLLITETKDDKKY